MKKLLVASLTALLLSPLYAAHPNAVSLNRGWKFTDSDGRETTVDLPHDFQIAQPWVEPSAEERGDKSNDAANTKSRLSARGFKETGSGTYSLTFVPADTLRGKRVVIDFGGIMLNGDAWLNGQAIGGTDYGYLGFEADVTKLLKPGEENELTVVANTGDPTNSRWYTGGGLVRGVSLHSSSPNLYFNRHPLHVTTTYLSPDRTEAKIVVAADINAAKPNERFDLVATVSSDATPEKLVATTHVDVQKKWRNREYLLDTITISNPALWSCESPNLYTLDIELRNADGEVADRARTNFGVRTIEYAPEFGFKLNGEKVLFKGIATHSTYGPLGAAAHPAAIEREIKMLKQFGFNQFRCSHNPFSEEFYDICDRNGMLVVDELYDKWLKQYSGGRVDWTSQWQHDVAEWVRRDRNHPCIVMWSLGNELQGLSNLPYNDWGVTAYNLMKTLLKKYDTERPLTVAMHPRYRSLETDSLPAPLALETDIAAYNYRYMYFPGDARRFPNLIFYQSEANMANMGPNFFVPDNSKVVGLSYWGMIDYLGESFGWPAKGWNNGAFDISLEPRPSAWFLKSMFTDEPTARIGIVGAHNNAEEWNGAAMNRAEISPFWLATPGDSLKIVAYTNCDEVELRVNGKTVGRVTNDTANIDLRNRPGFNVTYAPGSIEAIGYIDGKRVVSHKLTTPLKAAKFELTAEDFDNGNNERLYFVRVNAVDRRGNRTPLSAAQLTFKIEGNGELIAVGNGDINSDVLNTSDSCPLYEGSALAVVRTRTDSPETFSLSVTSTDFAPATYSNRRQRK